MMDFKVEGDIQKASQRWRTIADMLEKESDRGFALIYASLLETDLQLLLQLYFEVEKRDSNQLSAPASAAIKAMFQTFGPLSTFAAKIKMAYLLNLISETHYLDLEIARSIRNKFAHGTEHSSFTSPKILALVKQLKMAYRNDSTEGHSPGTDDYRARFSAALSFIGGYMSARIHVLVLAGKVDRDIARNLMHGLSGGPKLENPET